MAQKRVSTQFKFQYEDYDPGDYVEDGFKKCDDNFNDIYPLVNQTFSGEVSLVRELTHYSSYNVESNIAVTLADDPAIGGGAEIRMVGDGSHAPVFDAAFTKSATSDNFDSTLNTVNKVVFYYDGTDAFYSITVLS